MKVFIWALIGAVTGFVSGLVLSEIIAIITVLGTDTEPGGIRYLPLYLAAACAFLAAVLAARRGRRRGPAHPGGSGRGRP